MTLPARLNRSFAFAALAAILAASGCADWRRDHLTDTSLHTLPEFTSKNGVLTATLEATTRPINLGGVTVEGTVYNGEYAGPVLRVNPGDTMKIRLVNHSNRAVNIHYHGMETSPLANHDNIHVSVKPGQTFDYEVKIPDFQQPGLYWYHDHTYILSENNVMEGMSGALLVDGFAKQFPELSGVRERLLVLKDYEFDNSKDPVIANEYHNIIQSINGRTYSTIAMRPGETQLWHISNQSPNLYFHLAIKGHHFRILGVDGRAAQKETDVDTLDLPPAGRAEVLVDAGAAGDYALTSEKTLTGSGDERSMSRVLGKIDVSGEPARTVPPITDFPQEHDMRDARIDERRTVVFSQLNDDKNYFINGRKYAPGRIDLRIPLGNTEEWTIKNDSDDMHVFHIHQVKFQVVDINGKPQPFNGFVDDVRVPERGFVKIIIPFTNPAIVGQFVMHCHVLKHEDNGMMAHLEVYDPNPNGAFPFYRAGRNICREVKTYSAPAKP